MSNFAGYWFKIGNCNFTDPAPKRDGYHVLPHLRQTADAGVVASGRLELKVLPHDRTKITIQFPIMTQAQFQIYYDKIMHGDGAKGMFLEVEYYNDGTDQYETGTFYHTDFTYKPVLLNGTRMIDVQEFSLIEH